VHYIAVVVLLIAYGGILSSETNAMAKGWLDGRILLRYVHRRPRAPRLWDPLSHRWLDGCVRQQVDIGCGKGLWECGLCLVTLVGMYTRRLEGMGAFLMMEWMPGVKCTDERVD